MKTKNSSFIYLGGSVLLIIAAIVVTGLVNRSKNTASDPVDIRTKAGTLNTLKFLGTVASVDENKGTFLVDNLQFADSAQSSTVNLLGSWTVTIPSGTNTSSLLSGSKVTITVDPNTFLIASHTITASQINVMR